MASLTARLNRPVVRLIGKRLAAAETADAARRLIKRSQLLTPPTFGVSDHPEALGDVPGLTVSQRAGNTEVEAGSSAMLMFHGGGYVFGDPAMYRNLAGRIAKGADVTVHIPDYRLAPEHPHPAAVEDGLATYRALLHRNEPHRIVVGGDSAGGGLSVATLQAARDEGLPMPACMVLLSPWLDLTGTAASHTTNVETEELILPSCVDRMTGWYLGGHDATDPRVSPLFGEMHDLPPTLVEVSAIELLHSDSVSFTDKARQAGVEVELYQEADMWHVWQLLAPMLPEARASIARINEFVTRHVNG